MVSLVATDIGNRLRQLREGRGWSQLRLANAARVTRGRLSQVESGKIDKPEVNRLNQVALKLGVTIDYLMNGPAPDGFVTISVPEENAGPVGHLGPLPRAVWDWIEDAVARGFLQSIPPEEQPGREDDEESDEDAPNEHADSR